MDVYKVLKSQSVTSTTTVTYTVPPAAKTQVGGGSGPVPSPLATSVNTQALVTTLFVCNTHASTAADLDVNVSDDGGIVTSLYKSVRVYPGTTARFALNLTLKESDEVRAYIDGSSITVDATFFGIEMTTGIGPHA